jgi:hypothetical protein
MSWATSRCSGRPRSARSRTGSTAGTGAAGPPPPLRALIAVTPERPLHARAAADNAGSLRVLEKCGFHLTGADRDFAHGRGEEVDQQWLSRTTPPRPTALRLGWESCATGDDTLWFDDVAAGSSPIGC